MADAPDWWGRILGGLGLGLNVVTSIKGHFDRRPKVRVYAHRATDRTGSSMFQSAHASGIGPSDPTIYPPPRENLYLIVSCDKETELTKAWFQFGEQVVDVQSAQPQPPVRLLPHQTWHGWIPWSSVPSAGTAPNPQVLGRVTLSVTHDKVHESRPTPPNLLLGGNLPGPNRLA